MYKYIFGFLLIIVVLGGWYITGIIEENGGLKQDKINLKQSLKDSEKNYKIQKKIASSNAKILIETERKKAALNKYALEKAHELEVLKNENAEIKEWAVVIIPDILGNRLYSTAYNEEQTGLHTDTSRAITANTRASINVFNENLYQYAIDAVTALRTCNTDKAGVLESYNKIKVEIEKYNE